MSLNTHNPKQTLKIYTDAMFTTKKGKRKRFVTRMQDTIITVIAKKSFGSVKALVEDKIIFTMKFVAD
jgi:hypothetical protein